MIAGVMSMPLQQFVGGESSRRSLSGLRTASLCATLLLGGLNLSAQTSSAPISPNADPAKSATQGRDVVTEEELKKVARPENTVAAMLAKTMAQTPVTARPSMESSLYRKSVILYDGEKHTVVPVGSVLQLPPSYRNRVVEKPVGVFTFWPAFLERNAAWLGACEVPLRMAEGDQESAKKVLAATAKDPRVLVAVYRGGPITILEPVPEPASKAKPDAGATQEKQP
jgi:hypothetical protein